MLDDESAALQADLDQAFAERKELALEERRLLEPLRTLAGQKKANLTKILDIQDRLARLSDDGRTQTIG